MKCSLNDGFCLGPSVIYTELRESPNFGQCGQEQECDPRESQTLFEPATSIQSMGCFTATLLFLSTSAKTGRTPMRGARELSVCTARTCSVQQGSEALSFSRARVAQKNLLDTSRKTFIPGLIQGISPRVLLHVYQTGVS